MQIKTNEGLKASVGNDKYDSPRDYNSFHNKGYTTMFFLSNSTEVLHLDYLLTQIYNCKHFQPSN